MMTVLIIVLALLAVGLITFAFAAKHTPLGYQDADGFHFGNKEKKSVAAQGPLQDDFDRADWAIAPQHKEKPVEAEVLRAGRRHKKLGD